MWRKLLIHSFILAGLLLVGLGALAGVFPVTNGANTGAGSLRQAILNANAAGPGPHTINFTVTGVITVTSSLPAITVPGVTIDGGGTVTISGPAASSNNTVTLILLNAGANNTTIRGLTMQNTGVQPITINGALTGVTLENLLLRQTGFDYMNYGIYVGAAATNMTIRNVTITDIEKGTLWGIRFRSTVTGLNIDGLRIRNSGPNHISAGNDIRGIQFEGAVINSSIRNSTIDMDAPGVADDGNYGIYCNTTVNGLTMDSVQIHDGEVYNLFIGGAASNVNLNRCVFDNLDGWGSNQLVRFNSNATSVTIDSCVFDADQRNTTDDGNNALWFNGNMQTINVTKSTFNEADADGIYAFNGLNNDNITISGNTFTKIGSGGAHGGIHFTHVRNTTSDNGPVLFSDNIFRDINGVGIYVRPNNTTTYIIPNLTIRNNIISGSKVYGGIKVNYIDKIIVTQNSIYNNVGNGLDLSDATTANCGYEGANKPQLLSSAETSAGSGIYDIQVRMPAICGTNACSLELFSSEAGVKGIGGQHYVQTFTGLGQGVRTLTGVTGTFTEITGAPYGTWTATLRAAVNCGTSEFSNKIAIKVNGPAGVDLGIKLWLRGDEIFAGGGEPTADGQLISGWEEFSGGGGPSATTIVNNPVVRLGGINFNPIADMDGDVIRGYLPNAVSWLTNNTTTTVAVFNPLSITASGDRFFTLFAQGGWDYNNNKGQIEFFRTGNNVQSYRGSTLLAPPIPGTTGVSAFNKVGVFASVTTGTNHSAYYNAQSMGSGNYSKGNFALSQWFIGGGYGPDANGRGAWQWASETDFAEVFTYNRTLTPLELQKVQSYMALKYGIAMKQNYVLSSGTQVWDVAANAAYSKEIAALVRDNLSVLHQKQARAFHTDEPVTIALGSAIVATNKDITDSIANNLSVFMWGNDSAATVTTQTFTTGTFSNTRMPRVWKVQKTNWADTDITIQLKGGKDNNFLLISTDPTFATLQQELKLKKDGTITLSTALFPNGVYFTFGRQQRAPGGVLPDLDVWVKADEGVTATGTNATAVQDQSASQRNWSKVDADVLNVNSSAINYNPAFQLNGTTYFRAAPFTSTYTQGEVFSVQSSAVNNAANFPWQLGGSSGATAVHYRWTDNNMYLHWGTNARRQFAFGTKNLALPSILNLNTATNSWTASLDGRIYSTAAYATNFAQVTPTLMNYIGAGHVSVFNGPLSEVVQYKRKLNTTERLQVNSYLALKYGITIDQTAATNYLASNGTTTMWNAADNGVYKNNIAGIGRDDNGALFQKQSRSINTAASGNLIAVATGEELALNNEANTDSIGNDRSFLVWADDAGAITYTTAVTGENVTLRMPRVWKVDKTNWADTTITIKLFNSAANTYLLVSNTDASFATIDQELALNGDSTVTINSSLLPDGAYFTFAKQIIGPGFVNSGVRFWLRADDTKSMPSAWYDYSGNDNNAIQNSVPNQPLAVPSSINFNPGFDLDGANDYMDFSTNAGISGTNPFTVVSVTKRGSLGTVDMILGQNSDATNIFSYFLSTDNKFHLGPINVGSIPSTRAHPIANTPLLNVVTRSANLFSYYTNGAADGTGTQAYNFLTNNLRLGWRGGSTVDWFDGNINEVVVYNRPLNAAELLKVNSYLALKYGITLNNGTTDYIATDDTTKMWTVSKNTGFTRNITGIGRDDKTGLFQKQSRSIHDSTLTIALGAAVAPDNASNAGSMDDMSFFTFADNGLDTTYSIATSTGNGTVRMERVWKVDRTNWGDQDITFKVQPGGERFLLVHISDPTFGAGTQEFPINIPTSSVTLNTSNLPDGAYFTIATRITGPGCVNPNVLTWLRADYGATGGADWIDFSGNNNTVSQPTAANRANLVASGINFNPAFNFSGNQWFNIPNIYNTADSITAFFISRSDNVTINWQTLAEFGEDRPGLYWNLGGANEWVQTAVPTGAAHTKKFSTANAALFSFILPNSNPKNYRVGANGLIQTFTGSTGAFTIGAGGPAGVRPRLGGLVTDNSQDHFDGYISEVVFYRGVVHDTSLPKIHSYLALKYGISLDQTTPTDYVASDGTTKMWTAADNTGYNRRITGIGRDDCTNLYQKQSKSMDTGHVTLALGDIIHPTNAENLNTIDNNNSYFVIADNNADTTYNTEISGLAGITIRMLRTWKVDKTNWVDVDLSFQLKGGNPRVYLILSSDATFGAGDATYQLNDSGLVTIPTADIPDGAYFTFGKEIYGPGYVNNGVSLWLRADKNITSGGVGTAVTNWEDFSGNSVLFQQNGANPLPLLETQNVQFNYNPSLDFVSAGAEQMISMNSGDLIRPATFDNYSMFMAITKDVAANQRPFSMINTGSNGYALDVNVAGRAGISFDYENGVTIPINETKLLGVTSDGTAANRRGYHNGKLTVDNTTVTLTMSDILTGTAELGAANGNAAFGGHMAEVIVYNRQVTPVEAQRIQSYLALKYGVTLNQTTPNNYVASNWNGSAGAVYWDATTNTGYNNNIAGIGRDDSTSLLQKQSRSVNTTNSGNMVAIGLESIAATNAENTGTLADDLSFMVWGDNGATGIKSGNATAAEVPLSLDSNGCSKITRLQREWKVQETGAVGFVQLQFYLAGLVPNIPNSATISDFSLIIDDDGDFSTGTSTVVTPAVYDAATKTLTFEGVDFVSGQYFTLVTDVTNEAPGGVVTNLYTWYRSDKGVTTATGVNLWADQSVSLKDVTQATAGAQPAYNTTTPLINFNPTLTFDGTTDFLANATVSHTAATAGEDIFAVVLPANATGVQDVVGLGTVANTTNTTELRYNAGRLQYMVNTGGIINSAATNGTVQLANANRASAGSASLLLNGTQVATGTLAGTPALTQLNVGTRRLSAVNNQFFNGQVAEVAVYNRQLTQVEREKVASYLAIKYGITLTHSYSYPNGTVVFDQGVNAGYLNNITGIGRDDCNGLHQKQSKSINTGGMVTIASGTEVSPSNAANLNTLENSTALLFGDNNGNFSTWTSTEAPAGRNRIAREWKTQLTGALGTVTIQVPASTSTATTKLPAEINRIYMLVDDDGDFSAGATEVQMVLNGNNWEVSYEFTNSTYFTFATANNFLTLTSKVNLQGAYDGAVMRTDLKSAGLLPATDPYGLSTTPTVSPNTTAAQVVDWIRVELRDAVNPATVVTSRAAFVLANGNIVDTSYAQPLAFYGVDPGNYYVVVRHRNHLGVMSNEALDFTSGVATIDFTLTATATYGINAQKDLGSGVMGLWAGNVNGDSSIKYSAKPSDATEVTNAVLTHSGNTTASPAYTGFINAYSLFDVNLDGRVYYTATPSDHAIIVNNVKTHPANTFGLNSFIILQQLP